MYTQKKILGLHLYKGTFAGMQRGDILGKWVFKLCYIHECFVLRIRGTKFVLKLFKTVHLEFGFIKIDERTNQINFCKTG